MPTITLEFLENHNPTVNRERSNVRSLHECPELTLSLTCLLPVHPEFNFHGQSPAVNQLDSAIDAQSGELHHGLDAKRFLVGQEKVEDLRLILAMWLVDVRLDRRRKRDDRWIFAILLFRNDRSAN